MQFDNPDLPDKRADTANVITASELRSGLFEQQKTKDIGTGTQEASLPEDSTTFKPDLGGLIKDMKLPGQWTKVPEQFTPSPPGTKTEAYTLNADKDTTIFVSYNHWSNYSNEITQHVCQIMMQPDHKLSQSEINYVRKGLPNDNAQSNPEYFDLKEAWTKTINGKRVLFIDGTDTVPPKSPYLTVYIDSDPAHPGSLPESITYQGGQAEFKKYFPIAMKAFESIEWNAHVDTSNPM